VLSNRREITITQHPAGTAPLNCPVLVAGGVALKRSDGKWVTGMSDQPFTKELNWEPQWWSCIPQQNDPMEPT
jgi:hypothetical protein